MGEKDWLAELKGSRVALVGMGLSNQRLLEFLQEQGVRGVTACDRKTPAELGAVYEELAAQGVVWRTGEDYLAHLEDFDWVFLTPGMRKDLPELAQARKAGVRFASEIMLFLHLCPAPVIGITGSSGKTTTTTLVGKILRESGRQVFVGGNIGAPLITRLAEITPASLVVLELSSFQLEDLDLSPWIGAVLNVTPNHLDQHASMEEYIAAKECIWRRQGPADWTVLNRENPITAAMAAKTPGRVCFFSRERELSEGAFLADEKLFWRWGGEEEVICAREELHLLGLHNVENALAAIAITKLAGAEGGAARRVLTTFTGVEHRLELVREWRGIRFYNDSIATTPARTLAALRAFSAPLVLIAGGYDKHLPFAELGEEIARAGRRVKAVILIGVTAQAIEAAIRNAGGETPVIHCGTDFPAAVQTAARMAGPGEVVLLSPACASYDMFTNFAERGEVFRKLVRELA